MLPAELVPSGGRSRLGASLARAAAQTSRTLLVCFACACLVGLLGGVFTQEQHLNEGLLVDDAYITLRYATHLAHGQGLNYNAGERAEGYTSFAHVVLMALVVALDLDPVAWVKGLGLTATVLLLFAAFGFWRRLLGMGAALGLTAALAFDPRLATLATNGLETTLYMALLTTAWLALVHERMGLAGVLFGVTALTRMEALLQLAVAASCIGLSERPLRAGMRRALSLLVPAIALYGPYYVARYAYYGYPFPNAFYAKVGGPLDAYPRGLQYIADCVRNMGIGWAIAASAALSVPAVLLAMIRRTPPRRDRLAVAIAAALHVVYVVAVGGDFFLERFLYHVLPLLLATLLWPLVTLCESLPRPSWRPVLPAAFAAAVALTLAHSPTRLGSTIATRGFISLGRALASFMPPDTTLATGAAGALPYYSGLHTLDMLGLCDVHIAHHPVPMGKGMVGHERHDADYVLANRPDLIATWLDREGGAPDFPGGLPGYRLSALVEMQPDYLTLSVVVPISEGQSYRQALAAMGLPPERLPFGLFERTPLARWALWPRLNQPSSVVQEARSELDLEPDELSAGRYRGLFRVRLSGANGPCQLSITRAGREIRRQDLSTVAIGGVVQQLLWFDVPAPARYALGLRCSGGRTAAFELATLDRVR